MRITFFKLSLLAIAVASAILVAFFVVEVRRVNRFAGLQAKQLATIKQLESFPPRELELGSWQEANWRSTITTLYNVWSNTIYSYYGDKSPLTPSEMADLQQRLDEILADTNVGNSVESADGVFKLLLEAGQDNEFVEGYRRVLDEYRD